MRAWCLLCMLVVVMEAKSKRYRNPATPEAGGCDANEVTFRGTDNRWITSPEVLYSQYSGEGPPPNDIATGGMLPGISTGSNYGYSGTNTPGSLLTHCPDARTIMCDEETNIFHTHNYMSIPYDSSTYDHFMMGMFNYTKPRHQIKCKDYTLVAAYDPSNPTVPPSGLGMGEEPNSRSKLMFHSMQVFGELTNPEDGEEGKCHNFWGDGVHGSDPTKKHKRPNPPFICVYTPTMTTTYPTESTACAAFGSTQGHVESFVVNPNCGANAIPNATVHQEGVEPRNDFFQVILAPVSWKDRYNWEYLFAETPKTNTRFVDCDRALEGTNPSYAHLCLPRKKRMERHPLLTGQNIYSACHVSKQLSCAAPPEASLITEGTEPYCSFPYASSTPAHKRDPWDIYCFAGDLSSMFIENQAHEPTVGGNDYSVTPAMKAELHSIKSITDNRWTFSDWTPVFTPPPVSFTCPPVQYLFIEKVEQKEESGTKWVIRPMVHHHNPMEFRGDLAPFFSPLTNWEGDWPQGIPIPDGEINYTLTAEFKGMQLVTKKDRESAAASLNDPRGVSSTVSEDPDLCKISESGRHYGVEQGGLSFHHRGVSISCEYDFKMTFETIVIGRTPGGDIDIVTQHSYSDPLLLEYKPWAHAMSITESVYKPVTGEGSMWALASPEGYVHKEDPEAVVQRLHTCYSYRGLPSDCVVRTTQNVYGEAARYAHMLYRKLGVDTPNHFAKHVFFQDGICTTPSLPKNEYGFKSMYPDFCHKPSEERVRKWYKDRLGVTNRSGVWERQLQHIIKSDLPPIVKKRNDHNEKHEACKDLMKSEFASHIAPHSPLRKHFDLLHKGKARKGDIVLGKQCCPPPEYIDYDSIRGFFVKGEQGRSWAFTRLEHGHDFVQDYVQFGGEFVPYPPEWIEKDLYSSLSLYIGAMGIDKTTIRFLASYETPIHHCKYVFQTPPSTPIPLVGSKIPYHSIPHFFYMSPNVQDISGLARHSCRNESDTKPCHLILKEDEYPTISAFMNQIPVSLLCNKQGKVSSLPQSIYEIYDEFEALGRGSIPPTAEAIAAGYEDIVQKAVAYHPLHGTIKGDISYCRSSATQDCPLSGPGVPDTLGLFVEHGARQSPFCSGVSSAPSAENPNNPEHTSPNWFLVCFYISIPIFLMIVAYYWLVKPGSCFPPKPVGKGRMDQHGRLMSNHSAVSESITRGDRPPIEPEWEKGDFLTERWVSISSNCIIL